MEQKIKKLEYHIMIKQFAYVVYMEEDIEEKEEESHFWYSYGLMTMAIREYQEQLSFSTTPISEICLFLHKRCMKNNENCYPGKWSPKNRMIGLRICIDPLYIHEYMKHLNIYYQENKECKNISTLIYFTFIFIHPFSDGNGRIGKTFALLENDFNCKIKTFKQHIQLCKLLNSLQHKNSIFYPKPKKLFYLEKMLK